MFATRCQDGLPSGKEAPQPYRLLVLRSAPQDRPCHEDHPEEEVLEDHRRGDRDLGKVSHQRHLAPAATRTQVSR